MREGSSLAVQEARQKHNKGQVNNMVEEKKDGLATQTHGALEPAPDYIKKDSKVGFEDTVQSDVMIPRLALAQANSPQVTEGDPRRIPGLVAGELFNSVTGERYGKEVFVQLLRKMPLRAVQFRPLDDGGGIIDPNVPLNDPRCKWGTSGDKKKDKPIATEFRDFIAVILPQRELISLSFKSSGIRAAKELWGLAMGRNRDCFAGRFSISTGLKLDPKPHQVYKVANAGWVSQNDAILGEEMAAAVSSIKASQLHVEDEPDPDDFNPAEFEAGAKGARPDPGM